jgi:hypothetical protein
MHHWKGRRVDALVTPNHRMWRMNKHGKWSMATSDEHSKERGWLYWRATGGGYEGDVKIVTIPPHTTKRPTRRPDEDGPTMFAPEDFAYFLGVFIAEGWAMKDGSVCVSQNSGDIADKMHAAVEALNLSPVKTRKRVLPGGGINEETRLTHRGLSSWLLEEVGHGARNKKFPREVFAWSRVARERLLGGLIDGDGSVSNGLVRYGTASKQLADDVQQLCVDLGYLSCVSEGKSKKFPLWSVTLRITANEKSGLSSLVTVGDYPAGSDEATWMREEPYCGTVWCVTVPNGIFFTRRNGRVVAHGNSNRATVTEAERIMGQEVVLPRLERNRSEIQQTLVPMFDERLIAEFGSPIPVDEDFRLQSMQAAPWAATRGEWRELQGLENRGPVDDVHMVPFSLLEQGAGAKPAAADEPKAAKSHTHKDDKRDPLSAINALSADRLTSELDPLWKEKVKEWGDDALKDLGVAISFDLLNPLVTAYLEKFAADHITGKVNETTKQAIRDTLSEGVAAGDDIRNLSKRVTEVFDAARGARSIMIARTEVIGTSNFANMAAYAQSGLDLEKTWVSTPDDRVRETHADAMGQTRKLEEPFSVGGYEAQYPGDGSLPAEEIINCRCTVVAGVPGASRSIEQLTAIWKGYDARAAEWERQAIAALKRGFDKQQSDVLKALEAQE